jgi:ABC-type transporter lipoprotein component MlaA
MNPIGAPFPQFQVVFPKTFEDKATLCVQKSTCSPSLKACRKECEVDDERLRIDTVDTGSQDDYSILRDSWARSQPTKSPLMKAFGLTIRVDQNSAWISSLLQHYKQSFL